MSNVVYNYYVFEEDINSLRPMKIAAALPISRRPFSEEQNGAFIKKAIEKLKAENIKLKQEYLSRPGNEALREKAAMAYAEQLMQQMGLK